MIVYYSVLSILSLYSSLSLYRTDTPYSILWHAITSADKYKSYITPPGEVCVSAKPPFDGSRCIRVRVIPEPANQNGSFQFASCSRSSTTSLFRPMKTPAGHAIAMADGESGLLSTGRCERVPLWGPS